MGFQFADILLDIPRRISGTGEQFRDLILKEPTLIDELERRNLSTGLVTLCAAAGQSTAMIVERI